MSRKRGRDNQGSRNIKKARTTYKVSTYVPPNARLMYSMGELKGVDTSIVATSVLATTNTNGNILVLNLIRPGTGSWNRVGKNVRLKSVRMYGTIQLRVNPNVTTGDIQSNKIRMCLVWDKQPSGNAIPSFDTIFGTTDQAGTETSDVLDPLKYDSQRRFQILWNKVIALNVPSYFAAGGTFDYWTINRQFDKYLDLKNKTTLYSGQSSPQTIADIDSGALYLVYRAQTTSNYTLVQVLDDSFARVRYYDR